MQVHAAGFRVVGHYGKSVMLFGSSEFYFGIKYVVSCHFLTNAVVCPANYLDATPDLQLRAVRACVVPSGRLLQFPPATFLQ